MRIHSSVVLSLLPMRVQAMYVNLLSVPYRSLLVFASQLFSSPSSSSRGLCIDHISWIIRIRNLVYHRLLMLYLVLAFQNISLIPCVLRCLISILQSHCWHLLMCYKLNLLLVLLEKIVFLLLQTRYLLCAITWPLFIGSFSLIRLRIPYIDFCFIGSWNTYSSYVRIVNAWIIEILDILFKLIDYFLSIRFPRFFLFIYNSRIIHNVVLLRLVILL